MVARLFLLMPIVVGIACGDDAEGDKADASPVSDSAVPDPDASPAPPDATAIDAGPPDAQPFPAEWVTDGEACITQDGCPRAHCVCDSGTDLWVWGCLDGTCLRGNAWCEDFCLPRGGMVGASNSMLRACSDADTRAECLVCRDAATLACNGDPCAVEAEALDNCVEGQTPDLLHPGIENTHWIFTNTGICKPEADEYRACVDTCEVHDCTPDATFKYYPPPSNR